MCAAHLLECNQNGFSSITPFAPLGQLLLQAHSTMKLLKAPSKCVDVYECILASLEYVHNRNCIKYFNQLKFQLVTETHTNITLQLATNKKRDEKMYYKSTGNQSVFRAARAWCHTRGISLSTQASHQSGN